MMAAEGPNERASAPAPRPAGRRFSGDEAATRIAALQRLPIDDLDALFRAGTLPTFEAIEGATRGGWLAKRHNYWWAAAFIQVFLASPWARWTGKGFDTPFADGPMGRGGNLFANRILPRRHRFVTYVKHAEFDGRPCLTLEYPFGSVMWGLIDDVRCIEDGLFIGRMEYRFPWDKRRRFLGYFALCALRRA